MRHTRWFVPAVLVLAFSVGTVASAQDRGRRGRRVFGFNRSLDVPALLRAEQVREELEVGEEQAAKVDEILAAHRQAVRERMRTLRESDDDSEETREERQARREKWRKELAALREKATKKLHEVLEDKQTERLGQIELQLQGVDAMVSERVVKALELEEEKVESIRGILASRDESLQELRRGLWQRGRDGDREDRRARFEEYREKSEKIEETAQKEVLAALTEAQRKAFEKLKGEPFELDRRALFRGGRGRRGGDGDDGGRPRRRGRPDAEDGTEL